MKEGIIGILGGMGPEATLYLFQEIIKHTGAKRDQDHFRILIDNNPKIPDRTPAILGGGETPLPMMIETAKNLEKAGADFITIPCVSAHYFIKELRRAISIPVISIIDEVAAEIQRSLPEINRIGLIATTGTIRSGLFQERLSEVGVEVLVPSEETQEKLVMSAIYGESGIKAGFVSSENKEKVLKASNEMLERGAEGIIGGCTEVPLVLQQNDIEVPFFDSLDILALAAIRRARHRSS
ncbi:MAG: amino acid racemase [Deltaproteobacteria bacterium]|nr:amino acid racemase [Deltaproteobacteria bacterium]MBW2310247.1 amino acid racemase [Deltaproteobacteria bacterium]